MVVIETGANDGLRGQPPDSVRANLDAMVARVEAVSPKPVIVIAAMEALTNLGKDYGQRFRTVFPEVARAHHARYLPFLLAGVAGVDTLNQADGVHPNAQGSRLVAANVWKTLRPILDSLATH
jgi:acyl-CoA thioesterase-1